MYTQSITRTHRTAIILAIDGSGSMAEKIRFRNRQMTKAEAVATITNGMLFELIERARRSDGVRDYYDIAVIGYSGDDEVYSLLPGGRELISVAELAAGEPPMKTEVVEYRLPDGSISLREIPYPAWVEPEAAGQTPMCEALRRVRDIAAAWCADPAHAESFPPMVFNITDGEATDCDDAELRAVAGQIKSLRTADGNVLVVNIHIAAADASACDAAKKCIDDIVFVPEVGKLYYGRVVRLMTFGAFVELAPGKDGLVHISKLADHRIEKVEDACKIGDMMWVKVTDIDEKGRVNLSHKDAMREIAAKEANGERVK